MTQFKTIHIVRQKVLRINYSTRWVTARLSCGHMVQLGSLSRYRQSQPHIVCQVCTGATFDPSKLGVAL